ncbi:MAG TPA: AMP-binding protein, partial [Terriglobales bacterium]
MSNLNEHETASACKRMNHTERQAFLEARDFLLRYRDDYEKAYADFRWPSLTSFNWAWDYFESYASDDPKKLALWIVEDDGTEARYSFGELARRSNQVARYLQRLGVERGDRILLVLPNHVAIWEITLAALKIGAVIVPTSTLVNSEELHDRIRRADARYVIAIDTAIEKFDAEHNFVGIVVGTGVAGWRSYADAYDESAVLTPYANANATDPFLLYFTSGTTAAPKLVQHTQQSYPVGHLATMYWIGIRPDDLHCNISSP